MKLEDRVAVVTGAGQGIGARTLTGSSRKARGSWWPS